MTSSNLFPIFYPLKPLSFPEIGLPDYNLGTFKPFYPSFLAKLLLNSYDPLHSMLKIQPCASSPHSHLPSPCCSLLFSLLFFLLLSLSMGGRRLKKGEKREGEPDVTRSHRFPWKERGGSEGRAGGAAPPALPCLSPTHSSHRPTLAKQSSFMGCGDPHLAPLSFCS